MFEKKLTPRPKRPKVGVTANKYRDALTPSQRIFVYEMIKEMNNGKAKKNQTNAAIRAGYSPKTANEQAAHLMSLPKIKSEIEKELDKLQKRALITAESVLADIKEIGDRCMQSEPVLDKDGKETGEYRFDAHGALRSRELLGKNLELFTDKIKQNGETTINIVVDEDDVGKMEKE